VTAIDRGGPKTRQARHAPVPKKPRRRGLFRHLAGSAYKAVAVPDVTRHELGRAIDAPASWLDGPEIKVVKQGRSALIVKTSLGFSQSETAIAYKRCGSRNWARRFLRSLQTPRAKRNFHLGHALLHEGIATPRPIFAVSPRWRAFFRPSYLATQWIEGAVPLDVFLRDAGRFDAASKRAVLRKAAERLGHLIGNLHAHGFCHRDLKASNLLVRDSGGQVEAFVIDLDGAARPWFLSRRRRMANLGRLVFATGELSWITHALRHRALRAYLAAAGDGACWKTVWSELRQISRIRRSRRDLRSRQGS
jgi:tRNA A-37 threonylcarbamoyl transferase component Bud32